MDDPMFDAFRGFPESVRTYLASGNGVKSSAEHFFLADDDPAYRRLVRGVADLISERRGVFDDIDSYLAERTKPLYMKSQNPFFVRFLSLRRSVQELLAHRLRPAEAYYEASLTEHATQDSGPSPERHKEREKLKDALYRLLEKEDEDMTADLTVALDYVKDRLML